MTRDSKTTSSRSGFARLVSHGVERPIPILQLPLTPKRSRHTVPPVTKRTRAASTMEHTHGTRSSREFVVHAYYAAPEDDMEELTTADAEGEETGQENSMAATVLELPNATLEGVWEK